MQLLIPAAGAGSRFSAQGFSDPKPFIRFGPPHGQHQPMLAHVLENLSWLRPKSTIVLARQPLPEHETAFGGVRTVLIDKLTAGAACTALLAEDVLDPHEPLVIANSDQLVDFTETELCDDGGIFCFKDTTRSPKWSYIELAQQSHEEIVRVKEKQPISDWATCGIYHFARAEHFIRAARAMIAMNDRTNGEFYLAPVFNYLIAAGRRPRLYPVKKMEGIGTPEDLALACKARGWVWEL